MGATETDDGGILKDDKWENCEEGCPGGKNLDFQIIITSLIIHWVRETLTVGLI